jgi:protein tyrosine phosphatase
MPGRFETWQEFCSEASARGVDGLVCLNPLHEVASGSPQYHDAISGGALPWRWRHLPMRDFGLAAGEDRFRAQVIEIAAELRSSAVLVLHCAAGIGRTGTVAACLLKHLGASPETAIQAVRAAGSNPESAAQGGLIARF